MGIIDHQPGIEALGQFEQLRQRRQIAIHAEHRIGEDQLAPGTAARQPRGQMLEIAMRIADMLGARQLRGIDQRGVVEFVGKDGIVALQQRRYDRQIGHVAGAEIQRLLEAGERRQPLFQLGMRAQVAADHMRGATANAPACRSLLNSGDQRRMIGQPQIVIAAKGGQATPLDQCLGTTGRIEHAAAAQQACSGQLFQSGFQFVPNHVSAASRAATVRSASSSASLSLRI